tara:strand:- start:166 stop:486 length:321 start_codon:yes stop_codon:yes gene_type:complete
MQAKAFVAGLKALQAALPYGKKIDDETASFLWLTVDQQIKDEVSDEMWAYAVGRRLAEEEPPKEMAIHLSALRHVYRCENGRPNLSWGLKPQLTEIMSAERMLEGS